MSQVVTTAYPHVVAIGAITGELPETTQDIMINATRNFYKHFVAVKSTKT